jgi:hypothetical protein
MVEHLKPFVIDQVFKPISEIGCLGFVSLVKEVVRIELDIFQFILISHSNMLSIRFEVNTDQFLID